MPKKGVTEESERLKLSAELDSAIAYIYGLTETEFTYILSTFPLVSDTVKQATIEAYRNVEIASDIMNKKS